MNVSAPDRARYGAVSLPLLVAAAAGLGGAFAWTWMPAQGAAVAPVPAAHATDSVVADREAQAATPQEEAPSLLRALASVSPMEMRSDLFFLASDELRGRDTPSQEQRIAARFIRARLERLGFQPGGRDGSFLYEYLWPQSGLDLARTSATLDLGAGPTALTWAQDYFLGQGAFGLRAVEGGLVWGGADDVQALEGEDLTGKWVVVEPTERMPSGRRVRALESAGAVGLVVLPFGNVEAQMADLAARNNAYRGARLTSARARDDARFPVLHVVPRIAAQIKALVPADAPLGTPLPGHLAESCGFGRQGDAVLENVCGYWPGSDPVLKDEVILISAHYDHVGVRESDGEVFNGADDNASGTTGLLAIAQALKAYGPMRRSVMLIWVSGEEKGLFGSAAWTKDPSLPEGTRPLCNLNIDMIGRNDPHSLLITPTKKRKEYSALTQSVERHAPTEGFTNVGSADDYWSRSDHANFAANLKIPVAFLFTDVHEDYHKVTDTADKIDYDKASRVVRVVVRMLHDLQVDKPQF